ncbi:flavin reductase family protein [Streptomyces sp. NBC_00448]|uniref:flavin reductase family protein n=1 Tax=Streptomyces sp. NBC_00448 TaxID=2903652 RepID=UPI002E24895E
MTSTESRPDVAADLKSAFREAMAGVATPVAVVTAMAGPSPYGTTVSAFTSLSMDPPMVLVSLDRGSDLLAVIGGSRRFGLNILGAQQPDLAMNFARKGGPAKFGGVDWRLGSQVPRLPGASGFLACEVADLVTGGDHVVVFGRVLSAETAPRPPLTYHARAFGTHTALDVDSRA